MVGLIALPAANVASAAPSVDAYDDPIAASWPAFTAYADRNGNPFYDPANEPGISPDDVDFTSGAVKGIGDKPSFYAAGDGTNLFFRMRMLGDPRDTKGGFLSSVWLVKLYKNGVHKATVGLNGKSPHEDYIYMANAGGSVVKSINKTDSSGENVRGARVTEDDNGDYFLDFQLPISRLAEIDPELTPDAIVQFDFATSKAANLSVVNKDGMNGNGNGSNGAYIRLAPFAVYSPTMAFTGLANGADAFPDTIAGTTSGARTGSSVTVTVTPPGNGEPVVKQTTVTDNAWSVTGITGLAAQGTYTVTAVVTNENGDAATTSQTLTVGTGAAFVTLAGDADYSTFVFPTGFSGQYVRTTGGARKVNVHVYKLSDVPPYETQIASVTGSNVSGSPGSWGPDTMSYTGLEPGKAYKVKVEAANNPSIVAYKTIRYLSGNVTITVPEDQSRSSNATPEVSGTADSGVTVSLYVDGALYRDVVADENGSWTATIDRALSPNADSSAYHEFKAVVTADDGTTREDVVHYGVDEVNVSAENGAHDFIYINNREPAIRGRSTDTFVNVKFVEDDQPEHNFELQNVEVTGGKWSKRVPAENALKDNTRYTVTVTAANDPTKTATVKLRVKTSNSVHIASPVSGGSTGNAREPITGTAEPGALVELNLNRSTIVQVTANETGHWSYTPVGDWNPANTVIATTSDVAGNTSEEETHFTVGDQPPANGSPTAASESIEVHAGVPYVGQLKGADPDHDALTYAKASEPAHGTLEVEADGSFTYSPNDGYTGTDGFTFQATDEHGAESSAATIGITVVPAGVTVNAPPTANAQTVKTQVNQAYSGTLTGTDPEAGQLSYQLVDAPAHGTVTGDVYGGSFVYTPEPGYTGQDGFTFAAVDEHGAASAPSAVSITISNDTAVIELTADPDKIIGDGRSVSVLRTKIQANGVPVAGVPVQFSATLGTFLKEDGTDYSETPAVETNSEGFAIIRYRSANITPDLTPKTAVVTATVNDTVRGLHAEASIDIVFQPAYLSGKITETKANGTTVPLKGKRIAVKGDTDGDGDIDGDDFSTTTVTGDDGSYALAVPKGEVDYVVEYTKTVGSKEITYTQPAPFPDPITGTLQEESSVETVAGIIGGKDRSGNLALIDFRAIDDSRSHVNPAYKVYLKKGGGYVDRTNAQGPSVASPDESEGYEMSGDGLFVASGIPQGTYELEIRFYFDTKGEDGLPTRGYVVINTKRDGTLPNVSVGSGEMNINEELIDPYGIITDSETGVPVVNARVVLKYANTPYNIARGVTPDTEVYLPELPGFPPSDNASPVQFSDAGGNYAWMVYGDTDYYIEATASGYYDYRSSTIPVRSTIVRHDFQMVPLWAGGGSSSGPVVPTKPPVVVPAPPTDDGKPNLTVNLEVTRSLFKEETTGSIFVDYVNDGTAKLQAGEIVVTLPEGSEVIEPKDGVFEEKEHTFTWPVRDLDVGRKGSLTLTVKFPTLVASEKIVSVKAKAKATVGELIHPDQAVASLKFLVFSTRFGNLNHQRYILGYPDGTFKSGQSLTRAELAAVIARLSGNKDSGETVRYADVPAKHWAYPYIRTVTQLKLFDGYDDGTFRPDLPIGRGELAVVMTRYLELDVARPIDATFADAERHWAQHAIEALYRNGLLSGYPDGTFKPDEAIRRIEAVTLVNHMLYRGPVAKADPTFPDVATDYWGYGDVEEASVSHQSSREDSGSEKWVRPLQDDVQ
ncbi:hypothetical protein DLM86_27270 [Paenibacillus flagellatus]|uniref:SLH domain-containing protein n=2 Tax=Paenibacillus flagellatus TaxID=2211139 RepID=A0A2V5JZZ2_9BACL|nr:hypothetical protein DLM86_27270 [Paenibacillus flagellatus]